jgi:fructokinase
LAVDPPASTYEALLDRETGRRRIILDPNVRPEIFGDADAYRRRFERLARLADIVKLSDDDAAWIYPNRPLADVPEAILDFGPRLVALTRGASGAVARSRTAAVEVPGISVHLVDTVGAGDSFGAALIAALVDNGALGPAPEREVDETVLRRAVTYAVAASAVTCTHTGAVPPSRNEIEAMLATADADRRTRGESAAEPPAGSTSLEAR